MIPHTSRQALWITALFAVVCVQPCFVSAQSASLIFEDNFNTTTLDTTKWTIGYHDPDTGDVVPGARDQFLLNDSYAGYITEEDVQLHSGALHLLNQERRYRGDNHKWYDYTSGQVMSLHKFHFNKGYVEWRAQFPTGDSMWPALWLISEELHWGPEWDAFEYFGVRDDISAEDVMGMHLAYDQWPNVKWQGHWEYDFNATHDNEAWHVYGFEWTATEANWYVDGQLLHTLPNTIGSFWPNEEMYIVMNNGILSSETPADPADFPNSLTIDYVRVWDSLPDSVDFILGDMTGDGLVNLADVPAFIQALVDRAAYDAQGYVTNTDAAGDIDSSGTFDLGDTGAFSGLFGGPASASASAAPEPTALSLAILLLMGIAIRPRWRG